MQMGGSAGKETVGWGSIVEDDPKKGWGAGKETVGWGSIADSGAPSPPKKSSMKQLKQQEKVSPAFRAAGVSADAARARQDSTDSSGN
eukprot:gene10233-53127_t